MSERRDRVAGTSSHHVDDERVDTLVRGTLVNVENGRLERGAVAIRDGAIVALSERPADRVLEAEFVAPGLIDAHMHVEGSMVTLPRYGEAVLPRGVTSVVHDPHELANVLGEDGVRAVFADAERTPLKARFGVPSSVPASHLQRGGATLDADAVARLLDAERVVALAEVMDVPGVLAGDHEVHAKIEAARDRGLVVDGHMPRVRGERLRQVARHLDTDHESVTAAEAREKYEAGVRLALRHGSASPDAERLFSLLFEEGVDAGRIMLCTDDTDVSDLVARGGVNHAVERAMAAGIDPVTAVQLATRNVAETYGLSFGRLVPGAPADLVLLDDLDSWDVSGVLIDGEVVARGGECVGGGALDDYPGTHLQRGTVDFDPVEPGDLVVRVDATENSESDEDASAARARVRVIHAVEGIQTARMDAEVPVVRGESAPEGVGAGLGADPTSDVCHLACVDRYGRGKIGRGFVHGLGIEHGAVAMTIAHDTHNLVVAGANPPAMARAANRLRVVGGGVCVVDAEGGETTLSLPVAGLMSDGPLSDVARDFEAVEDAAREIGLSHEGGLMSLSFLALEVIPEYRLTTGGLVDAETMERVDVRY